MRLELFQANRMRVYIKPTPQEEKGSASIAIPHLDQLAN